MEDKVFSAIADSNRRKIVELLHRGDSTLLELDKEFDFSFQALSKHIKILEDAQIIEKERRGKYRTLRLNREAFKASLRWMSYYSDFWNQSFDKLDHLIKRSKSNG